MKIGIVTQPIYSNYGGILQAFALQCQLVKMGHDPIIIDCIPYMSRIQYILRQCKTIALICVGKKRLFYSYSPIERIAPFKEFIERNLKLTQRVNSYSRFTIKQYGIEAVIVGSDQVWRPIYNVYLQDMYLRFVPQKIKKMSYAASFGVDCWEYTDKQTEKCKKYISRFIGISVRENSGIKLCLDNLGKEAVEVLDPTLLLTNYDYMKLCKRIPCKRQKYLAAYILDMNQDKYNYIEMTAKAMGIEHIYVYSSDNKATLSVEGWLAMFRDASYVITDSYHGTVFSILFHKKVSVIVNEERGKTRFTSLLEKLGLQELLVSSTSLPQLACCGINWENVDKKLDIYRRKSILFLEENLSSQRGM